MADHQPTIVGGRYELGELLGRGGMAEVRKGTDTRLGRVVAVKRLRTDLASDATFQARFRREAQSSASLNHPAIVAVYDTGEEVVDDGGTVVRQPYIVMEYVAGRTLRDILREGRKILPERALEITSGVLSALDYSHRAGIIHRDIKPGNVMLTPSGDVKVMDFGIARAISDASSTMTQTAAVVGTAQYLSPEQARGETVDSRSDVYSAGCLLYELLTGRPPFVGDSPVAVAYQHVREQPQPPSDFDADLPPEVDAIVLKALAKRVEDRYQSAAAMRNDIERYLDGRPISVVAPSPAVPTATAAAQPIAVVPSTTEASGPIALEEEYDDYERGSRMGWIIGTGVIVIALIAVGIWGWGKLFPGAPEQVQVPSLTKLTEDQARETLTQLGLVTHVSSWEASEDVDQGAVISQTPDPDSYVDPGSTVELVLSSGKPQVELTDLTRMQFKEAKTWLQNNNLLVKREDQESDEQKGLVLEMNPTAGTSVAENTTVTLYVSLGPKTVPDVLGMSQADAEAAIRNAGFTPERRDEPNTTEDAGTVVDQFPAADTPQDKGTTVLIFVSTYEPPVCEYDSSILASDPDCVAPPTACVTPTPGTPFDSTDPTICAGYDPNTGNPLS
ncbi:Stk1 family PASTA domain-containing Ser/Thr kinase [Nocardioides sp.]|uniref:Stk1 family PASTA domain-containing Ser/Thr kinase n=1 Tax=Nocardioides sp. TaxID=35761 RepID=UPI0039E5A51C